MPDDPCASCDHLNPLLCDLNSCHLPGLTLRCAGSQRVLSTSFDNTLRVLGCQGGTAMASLLRVKHNNNTGGLSGHAGAAWGELCRQQP